MAQTKQARIVRALASIGGSQFASITFRKVSDGSMRTLTINPRAKYVGLAENASPTAKRASATRARNNPDLVNVYDVHGGKWKSLYAANVTKIRAAGVEISF